MRRDLRAGSAVTALLMALAATVAPSAATASQAAGPDIHRGGYTDWGPWQTIPTGKPEKFRACGTTVTVRTVVNKERIRFRRDGAGNVYQQFRGPLRVRLHDDEGRRSARLDVSGRTPPGGAVAYKDGRFMYDALGANIIFPHRALDVVRGMPRAFVSQGPITLLSRPHKRVRMLREPQSWISVCRLLNGAEQPAGDHDNGGYTDWGPWEAAPLGDVTHDICGTTVKEHVITDGEENRSRTDSRGNVYTQIRGDFVTKLTAADGSTTGKVSASGETPRGGLVAYLHGKTRGDVLIDMLGRNETIQDPAFGINRRLLPASFTQGPLTALRVDRHVRLLRKPQTWRNICRMLAD